ncbi:MAG: pilus assembly protein PilM [Candidatus Omnitrophica bacterium]|nr:pilus assembly protein PilM [Candidatus Omnitrophota bacterium]MDD5351790.1 pilus assembly protein PilM [Candidatus Omnitrophota bacterium]MDD5550616.1 pilus assembly protein PilM [Candidatus Omnitrophota bacterium]
MKNKIKKDISKTKAVYTAIEFSPHRIKLAQSYFKKQRFINKLLVQDNLESEYDFINALEKIIKEKHLKIDNLVVSLDRSLVTVRFIKLPSSKEEEIEGMAKWQAAKILPYKIDEIVVSHQTIKTDHDGFSYVLLVIATKDIIKKFADIYEGLKSQVQSITLTSEGLLNWYNKIQPGVLTEEALALINIEKDAAELVIIYENKFIFSRSLNLPSVPNDHEINNKIIEEVKLSFESYSKQDISPSIKKIILTGHKNQASDLPSLLKTEFNLQVDAINHLRGLNLEIDGADIPQNISFASICGLALNVNPTKINLLPQESKDKISYLEKKKELFRTLYLALFAILIFIGLFGFNLYNKREIINSLDKQLVNIDPIAKEVQDIKNKIAIINTQIDNNNSCIEILREIHKITPNGIYINTFIFEEKKEVILKGTAPAMSEVFSFVPILNESPLFENVEVRYATQRKTQSEEVTDFEIVCKLNSKAKNK